MIVSCLDSAKFQAPDSLEMLRQRILSAYIQNDFILDCSAVASVSLDGVQLLWSAIQTQPQSQIIPSEVLEEFLRRTGFFVSFQDYFLTQESHG